MNNDTRSYDKYNINIDANFRDATGRLISSHSGYIDAEILRPGESSAFNVYLFGGEAEADASTYDLIINDERIVQGQSLEEEFEAEQPDQEEEDDQDEDNNNDDEDNN